MAEFAVWLLLEEVTPSRERYHHLFSPPKRFVDGAFSLNHIRRDVGISFNKLFKLVKLATGPLVTGHRQRGRWMTRYPSSSEYQVWPRELKYKFSHRHDQVVSGSVSDCLP